MLKQRALLLTQGMHGMISQVEGLAKALGLSFKHEETQLKKIWNFFPPKLTPVFEGVLSKKFVCDAKVVISGGAESSVTPLGIAGFATMHALSTRNDDPQKASRPFDKDRDGFVMGEGSGMLILEDYEFAKARGARIYCEITGYGFSSDAHHVTSPSAEGPARAMKMTLKDSGLAPEEIDYVNAHGTSTPVGDLNELRAIKMALGEKAAQQLSISSTKSMTGHLLGAAAAIEAIFSIKALHHNFIPPTINIENLDPECDLDVTPNTGKSKEMRVAMSNACGFGGTNASIIFQKID